MDTYKQQPSSQSHPSQLQTKLVTTKNLSVEHINNSGILEVSFDYKTDDTVAGNYGMFLTGDFTSIPFQWVRLYQGRTSYERIKTFWDVTKVLKNDMTEGGKSYSIGVKLQSPSGSDYQQAINSTIDIVWSPKWKFKDDNTPLDYITFNDIDTTPSEIYFEFQPFNGSYKYHISGKLEYYSSGTWVGANMPYTPSAGHKYYDSAGNMIANMVSSSELQEVDNGLIGDSELVIGSTNARCIDPKWVGVAMPEPLIGDWEDYIDDKTEIKITCKSNTEAI